MWWHAAAEKSDVVAWKEVLSEAQRCEQLGKGRKSLRKLMLLLYGGHSAYHDAKAHTRLAQAHKVRARQQLCNVQSRS